MTKVGIENKRELNKIRRIACTDQMKAEKCLQDLINKSKNFRDPIARALALCIPLTEANWRGYSFYGKEFYDAMKALAKLVLSAQVFADYDPLTNVCAVTWMNNASGTDEKPKTDGDCGPFVCIALRRLIDQLKTSNHDDMIIDAIGTAMRMLTDDEDDVPGLLDTMVDLWHARESMTLPPELLGFVEFQVSVRLSMTTIADLPTPMKAIECIWSAMITLENGMRSSNSLSNKQLNLAWCLVNALSSVSTHTDMPGEPLSLLAGSFALTLCKKGVERNHGVFSSALSCCRYKKSFAAELERLIDSRCSQVQEFIKYEHMFVCCNNACTNLTGPSELALKTYACGERHVRYCCCSCRNDHWKKAIDRSRL